MLKRKKKKPTCFQSTKYQLTQKARWSARGESYDGKAGDQQYTVIFLAITWERVYLDWLGKCLSAKQNCQVTFFHL